MFFVVKRFNHNGHEGFTKDTKCRVYRYYSLQGNGRQAIKSVKIRKNPFHPFFHPSTSGVAEQTLLFLQHHPQLLQFEQLFIRFGNKPRVVRQRFRFARHLDHLLEKRLVGVLFV